MFDLRNKPESDTVNIVPQFIKFETPSYYEAREDYSCGIINKLIKCYRKSEKMAYSLAEQFDPNDKLVNRNK